MPRPYSPVYSPVRLPSSQPMSKRSLSSDERDSSTSCSSYSTSTSSSSIPSPDDNDRFQSEQADPFGLEFSMSHLGLERLPAQYFPSEPERASSVQGSAAAHAPVRKMTTSAHPIHADEDSDDDDEENHQVGHRLDQGWEREVDAPTPRQEQGPVGCVTTPSAGVELDAYPFVQPTDKASDASSPPVDPNQDPTPVPLPHLHLIPRPPPTPAVRKYSSGLLTATRAMLQISLSPNPSPSQDNHTSYFTRDESAEGQGWGQNKPDEHDRAEPNHDEGDCWWSPTHTPPADPTAAAHDEDGAFTLEDEGSYDRRFSRLRREAEERAEALKALRAGSGSLGGEAVVLEERELPRSGGWVPGHERSWSTDDEGLGDEGVHHVEYSGYP